MNLLQIFFTLSGVVILILALDIARKQKFNALHFLVFLWVWWGLLIFSFFPKVLDKIGNIFWVARWADVLVYSSIIFLVYFVLLLLSKHVNNKESITHLVRNIAIENSSKRYIKWEEVFVIPLYNEVKVIKSVIDEIFDNGYKNIIIINDWSKDNSKEILEWYKDKIILLNHYINRGQWAALETGFEYVRKFWKINYVITYDSDGQHSIEDVNKIKKIIKKNKDIDIFLWSRFLKESKTNVPFLRLILLKLWVLFTFILSKIHLTDTHNGFRVMKRKTLNKIKITMDGMWHASEIIDLISKNKIKYKEIPVTIRYTEYSLSKWQKSSNAVSIAFKFIWNKFFK